jgi:hypothetical protein
MDQIQQAFSIWRKFIDSNRDNPKPGLIIFHDLAKQFQKLATEADLSEIFEIGIANGFAQVSIINILILHGAYFRLLQAGIINRGVSRFVDSLYQPTFPELSYNVINLDILAPWITLPAQEILLDLGLSNFTVVEYGSGISTFFFCQEAMYCYSFEDDLDPAGRGSWSSKMINQSINQSI